MNGELEEIERLEKEIEGLKKEIKIKARKSFWRGFRNGFIIVILVALGIGLILFLIKTAQSIL